MFGVGIKTVGTPTCRSLVRSMFRIYNSDEKTDRQTDRECWTRRQSWKEIKKSRRFLFLQNDRLLWIFKMKRKEEAS